MKNITVLIVAALILSSACSSLPQDTVYQQTDTAAFKQLKEYELGLFGPDSRTASPARATELTRIAADLYKLGRKPNSDPAWRARLSALLAETARQQGDIESAQTYIREALSANKGEELAYIAQARLKRTDEQETLLRDAIQKTDTHSIIKLELAILLSEAKNYREAVSFFDAALNALGDPWSTWYQAQRDTAFALLSSGATPMASSADYLKEDPLSLLGMIVLTQNESALLSGLADELSPEDLFLRLTRQGFFPSRDAQKNDPCTRKIVAWFIWRLLNTESTENLTRYSRMWGERISPILDVSSASPYFDAVLGTVERGIFTLKDGKLFSGEEVLSGMDFLQILGKMPGQ